MGQERLNGLALMFVHRDLVIDVDKVISDFKLSGSRRIALWLFCLCVSSSVLAEVDRSVRFFFLEDTFSIVYASKFCIFRSTLVLNDRYGVWFPWLCYFVLYTSAWGFVEQASSLTQQIVSLILSWNSRSVTDIRPGWASTSSNWTTQTCFGTSLSHQPRRDVAHPLRSDEDKANFIWNAASIITPSIITRPGQPQHLPSLQRTSADEPPPVRVSRSLSPNPGPISIN